MSRRYMSARSQSGRSPQGLQDDRADARMMNLAMIMIKAKGRCTVFNEVVSRQTLQACGARKALREYGADGGSEFVPLFRLPFVDILQKCRE